MRFAVSAFLAALGARPSSAALGSLRRVPEEATAATYGRVLQKKKKKATVTQIVELTKQHWGDEEAECEAMALVMDGAVGKVLPIIHGCTIEVPKTSVQALSALPSVAANEEDGPVTIYQSQNWGLDRINQEALPLDGSVTKMDANGVRVYILDTGVQGDHSDFEGMTNQGCSADTSGDNGDPFQDDHGHGTHVASTACGLEWGVAANCELCAVQVLTSSGSGSNAGVIAGVQFAVDTCADDEKKCVINMSLGGGRSTMMNDAVEAAVNAGVTVVVAAGNDTDDADNYSPASAEKVITVGSTTHTDSVSSFSNYGDKLDIYAPGSLITAAWPPNTINRISGTSMASPHVAGIAAGHLGSGAANNPTEVLDVILANQVLPGIDTRNGAGDQGLATIMSGPQGPTPPPTPTPAPTQCVGKTVEVNIKTDNYPDETTWTITDAGNTYGQGGPFSAQNTLYEEEVCLNVGNYEFKISDSYGDGICCGYGSGEYKVFLEGTLLKEGGQFGGSETVAIEVTGGGSPTPPPTPGPTPPPTPPPTPAPTPPPTPAPTPPPTPGPTFFSCAQFNEHNEGACTNAYGGGKCQWIGDCENCGCVPTPQDE